MHKLIGVTFARLERLVITKFFIILQKGEMTFHDKIKKDLIKMIGFYNGDKKLLQDIRLITVKQRFNDT